jgi:hypothetical protein
MDIRKPILPVPGTEALPRVQPSLSDRQRQSLLFPKREKKKHFPPPEQEERGGDAGREEDVPEARLKGRSVETVVDGAEPGEGERTQGSNVDVLA